MSNPKSKKLRDGDTINYRAVRQRFTVLNSSRLTRLQDSLRSRQQPFLDIVPLLFHINHPLLPGYISKETPAGIYDYQPGKRTIAATKQLFKGFAHKRRALFRPNIHALFVMGSSGTIAYSDKSDFDFWLCHAPDLDEKGVVELQQKAEAIEKWAESLDLEVHFFLMDADKFRLGEQSELSKESSGSAQHHLLLDEFYRTSIHIAGKIPLWWLVPPEHDRDYDNYSAMIKHQRFISEHDVIDFGGLSHIPAGEFLGAALWQLFKGIDSPYKSVLKILVMEAYANEHPNIDLLSLRFKNDVYDGVTSLDQLDPYIMMYNKVAEYLATEPERLELARRCFYFKIDLPLSEARKNADWRTDVMRYLTQKWGWNEGHICLLDSRSQWKVEQVQTERRMLVDELTLSYRLLTALIREHGDEAHINAADLNILGRKIYAAFERKGGKIELVNPGISDDLSEQHLTIQQSLHENNRSIWSLHLNIFGTGQVSEAPVKRASSLLELLAWCHFNHISTPRTTFTVKCESSTLTDKELRATLEAFNRSFPKGKLPKTDMEELSQPARTKAAATFINIGFDPLTSSHLVGTHLTTGRTDALSFGATWDNLALSFDQVLANSWHEIHTYRASGNTSVLRSLCKYFETSPISKEIPPPPMAVSCLSSSRGVTIARRIEDLYHDVTECFFGSSFPANSRYLLRIKSDFYIIRSIDDRLGFEPAGSLDGLYKQLATPQPSFSPIVTDRHTLNESPLPTLFKANAPNVVQLFYYAAGEQSLVYILDEKGSLFYQEIPFHDSLSLLTQYQWFFDTILPRLNFLISEENGGNEFQGDVELNQIIKNRSTGEYTIEPRKVPINASAQRYFNVQVIGDMMDERPVFTIYCDEREFSSLEHGDALFERVARDIFERRSSGESYPIYITDIDISKSMLGSSAIGGLQTIHYLNHKRRIEERLNHALNTL